MNENARNSGEAVCKEDERKRKCVEKRRKGEERVVKCEKMNENCENEGDVSEGKSKMKCCRKWRTIARYKEEENS